MAQKPRPTNVITQFQEQRKQRSQPANNSYQKENLVIAVTGYDQDEDGQLYMTGFDPHDENQSEVQIYISEHSGRNKNTFSMEKFIQGEKANEKHSFDIPPFEIHDDPNDSLAVFERATQLSEGLYTAEFAKKVPQGTMLSKSKLELRITPSKQQANVTVHATNAAVSVPIDDTKQLLETIVSTLNARDNALRGANVRLIAKDESGKLQFRGMHFKQLYAFDEQVGRNAPMRDGKEWLETLDQKVQANTATDYELSMYENLHNFLQIASSEAAKELGEQAKWEVIPTSTYPIASNFKKKLFETIEVPIGESSLNDYKSVLSRYGKRLFNQYAVMRDATHSSRQRMLVDSHFMLRAFDDDENGFYMTDVVPTQQFTKGYLPLEVPTVNTDCSANEISITRRNAKLTKLANLGTQPVQSTPAAQQQQQQQQQQNVEAKTQVEQTPTPTKPVQTEKNPTQTKPVQSEQTPAQKQSESDAVNTQQQVTEPTSEQVAPPLQNQAESSPSQEQATSMANMAEDEDWFGDMDMSDLIGDTDFEEEPEEPENSRSVSLNM